MLLFCFVLFIIFSFIEKLKGSLPVIPTTSYTVSTILYIYTLALDANFPSLSKS